MKVINKIKNWFSRDIEVKVFDEFKFNYSFMENSFIEPLYSIFSFEYKSKTHHVKANGCIISEDGIITFYIDPLINDERICNEKIEVAVFKVDNKTDFFIKRIEYNSPNYQQCYEDA